MQNSGGFFGPGGFGGGFIPAPVNASRVFFYSEDGTNTTHTGDTTYTDKTVLTFTGNANKNYYLIWSMMANTNAAQTDNYGIKLRNKTSSLDYNNPIRKNDFDNTGDRYGFCGLKQFAAGASPVSTSFAIQYQVSTGTDTVNGQYGNLIAIEAGANDQYAEANTATTNASTVTLGTQTTLTFTPATAGDYLIIACAEVNNGTSHKGITIQLTNGATAYGLASPFVPNSTNWLTWGTMVQLTSLSGAQTFTIDFKAAGAGTASCRNARIVAFRLSDFSASFYSESRGSKTTTSSTAVDDVSITQTVLNKNFVSFASAVLGADSTSSSNQFQLRDNGTIVAQHKCINDQTLANGEKQGIFLIRSVKEPAQSIVWKSQYNSSLGATLTVTESAIAVLKLDA